MAGEEVGGIMCGHHFPTAKYPGSQSDRGHPYIMWFGAFPGDRKQSLTRIVLKTKPVT